MKVELEEYRGWTISFDTEKESFYCHSDGYDKDDYRKSFSATKKFIDEFIKENEKFTPVWVEKKPSSYGWSKQKIKLIGIRKDGRFIYEDEQGEKRQLSDYYEEDYILYNPDNDKFRELSNELECKIDLLRKEKESVLSKIQGIKLVDYKKTLGY